MIVLSAQPPEAVIDNDNSLCHFSYSMVIGSSQISFDLAQSPSSPIQARPTSFLSLPRTHEIRSSSPDGIVLVRSETIAREGPEFDARTRGDARSLSSGSELCSDVVHCARNWLCAVLHTSVLDSVPVVSI